MTTQKITSPDGASVRIPDRYRKLGVSTDWSPTPFDELRIWISAFPGHGKTTFLGSDPSTLIQDFAGNARDVARIKAGYTHLTSIEQMNELNKMLIEDQQCPFSRIAIDTIDDFIEMAIPFLTEEYGVAAPKTILEYGTEGSGYSKLADYILRKLQDLTDSSFGWTVTGHLQDKRGTTRAVAFPSIMAPIYRKVHMELYLERAITNVVDDTAPKKTAKFGNKEVAIGNTKKSVRYLLHVIPPDEADTKQDVKTRYLEYMALEPIDVTGPQGMLKLRAAYDNAIAQVRKDLSAEKTVK